jgi:hypothetical protein
MPYSNQCAAEQPIDIDAIDPRDVDTAVRHSRERETQARAGAVSCRPLFTVVELSAHVLSIIRSKNSPAWRVEHVGCIDEPHDVAAHAVRRHGGRRARRRQGVATSSDWHRRHVTGGDTIVAEHAAGAGEENVPRSDGCSTVAKPEIPTKVLVRMRIGIAAIFPQRVAIEYVGTRAL